MPSLPDVALDLTVPLPSSGVTEVAHGALGAALFDGKRSVRIDHFVVDGKLGCTVECNPLFGPKVYDTIAKVLAGEAVPKKAYNHDELFDAANAAALLPARQY